MSKFKVGDEVQILDKSIFRNQGYQGGEKMRGVINRLDSSGWWSVTWDNGFTNTYRDEDLEPYGTTTLLTTSHGFHIGERVIVCENGFGFSKSDVGKEFIIVEFGDYGGDPGVKLKNVETSETHENVMYNDFVGIKSIKKIETTSTSTSELEENITFTVNGRTFNYTLCSTYYSYSSSGNDVIFNELGVDKDLFCSKVYGYEALDGSWPEWRDGDNEAPIKIIKAIREKIKEMESEPKIDVAEQPEERVTFTVNGNTFNYELDETHYSILDVDGYNDAIFGVLGVDKHSFCSETYGYEHDYGGYGGWPEWRKGDNEAPIKIVRAIREKIKEMESMPKSEKQTHKFKTGDKVTYKYQKDLLGQKYFHGGDCHGGFVGVIISIDHDGSLYVTTRHGLNYHMLPNEFVEYDEVLSKPITTKTSKYKFEVGDTVVGNYAATDRYSVTGQGWCGKVTEVYPAFFLAEGPADGGGTHNFELRYEYFDLAKSKAEDTKYAILEEAKRRYPVGTKYHAIGSDGIKYGGDSREKATYECRWVDSGLGIDCGIGYVYANGKWAKIVGETKGGPIDKQAILEEARRRYPIGITYIPISAIGDTYISPGKSAWECKWVENSEGANRIDCGLGYVYVDGKWAEIECEDKYVVTQRTPSYPAGTATFGTTKELPYTQTPIIINKKEKKQKIKVI